MGFIEGVVWLPVLVATGEEEMKLGHELVYPPLILIVGWQVSIPPRTIVMMTGVMCTDGMMHRTAMDPIHIILNPNRAPIESKTRPRVCTQKKQYQPHAQPVQSRLHQNQQLQSYYKINGPLLHNKT